MIKQISYEALIRHGYENRQRRNEPGNISLPGKAINPATFHEKFLFPWVLEIAGLPNDTPVSVAQGGNYVPSLKTKFGLVCVF